MKFKRYTTKAYYVYYTPQLGRRKEGWISGLGITEEESVKDAIKDCKKYKIPVERIQRFETKEFNLDLKDIA